MANPYLPIPQMNFGGQGMPSSFYDMQNQMPQNLSVDRAQLPQQPTAQPQAPMSAPPVDLAAVAAQYQASQPQQNDQSSFIQKILATRFQPNENDVSQSNINTAMAFGAPNLFKPTTPQDIANQRTQTELAPYSTMLDYGIKERQAMPDFTKMAQMAFMKQASGQPMTLQDQSTINAWRSMGQNGIMFDPSTGSMIQTNTRMPGGMAQPGMQQMPTGESNGQPLSQDQVLNNAAGQPNTIRSNPQGNFPTPKSQGKFLENLAGKTGDALGDASKTLDIMQSNLPMALQRFENMRKAAENSNYGFGTNNEGTGFKQELSNQLSNDTATSNNTLQQYSSQGILPELGPQLAQAGIRGNKFLETLASNASGLNMSAPPATKKALIDGLENTYIGNLKSTAAQLRANGLPAPSDQEINSAVLQIKQSSSLQQLMMPSNNGQDMNVQTAINPQSSNTNGWSIQRIN